MLFALRMGIAVLLAAADVATANAVDVQSMAGKISSAIAKSRSDFSPLVRSVDMAYDALKGRVNVSRLTSQGGIPIWEYVDRAEDAATAFRRLKPQPLQPLISSVEMKSVLGAGSAERSSVPKIIRAGQSAIAERRKDIDALKSARAELDASALLARQQSETAWLLSRELNAVQERGGAILEIFFSVATQGKSFALSAAQYEAFVVKAFEERANEAGMATKRLDDVISIAEKDLVEFRESLGIVRFMSGKEAEPQESAGVGEANPYRVSPQTGSSVAALAEMRLRHREILAEVDRLTAEANEIDSHNSRLEDLRRAAALIGGAAGASADKSEPVPENGAAGNHKEAPATSVGAEGPKAPAGSAPTAGSPAPKATPAVRPAVKPPASRPPSTPVPFEAPVPGPNSVPLIKG